jgi:hypothetical protein
MVGILGSKGLGFCSKKDIFFSSFSHSLSYLLFKKINKQKEKGEIFYGFLMRYWNKNSENCVVFMWIKKGRARATNW